MEKRVKDLILETPIAYRLFQKMNGADKMRKILSKDYICAKEGDNVLDIACGTADILPYLGESIYYTGVDLNEGYINHNRKAYLNLPNASFICEELNDFLSQTKRRFDIILLMGVLHHMSDDEMRSCLKRLPDILNENGRIISMDGCYTDGLNHFERFLLRNDRGKYVRTIEHWKMLLNECLKNYHYEIRKDLYFLPYNLLLMTGGTSQ